jgi:signal transduction histidine kinase
LLLDGTGERAGPSNFARHAQANNVRVAIEVGSNVTLIVANDGIGVPEEVVGGRGLKNLTDRATALNGNCTIIAVNPRGSQLTWQVPAHTTTAVDKTVVDA